MKKSSTSLICFDMWGTLVEGGGRNQITDLKTVLRAEKIDDLTFLNQVEQSRLTRPWPIQDSMHDIARKLHLQINEKIINNACKSWWHYVNKARPYPETENVLIKLKKMRIDMVIISNTDIDAFNFKIQQLCWKKFFKRFFLSAQLGMLKPDTRVFQTVEKELNTPKKNVLMVDDSLYHGVIPARRFGWQALWINRGKAGEDENEIRNLNEVIEWMKRNIKS